MDETNEIDPTAMPEGLRAALGGAASEVEIQIWRQLTPAQRQRTLARVDAVQAWANGNGDVSAAEAAGIADVSVSRFYRLAADWKAKPSLVSLGTFAGAGPRRSKFDPDVINALQAVVARVVKLNAGASVSKLVDELIAEAGVSGKKLPGQTKLREIVQAERRRVDATHDAGTAITFDCVATSLPRADGRPHVLFTCIDRGTRVVLGTAFGDPVQSVAGHAAAAADALATIESKAMPLPWAFRLAKGEITAGADIESCVSLATFVMQEVPGTNFQISRSPKRFGRYVRELIGPRIGSIAITPTRTLEGNALAANGDLTPWSEAAAVDAARSAFDAHNREVLAQRRRGGDSPPADLIAALRLIAKPPS